MAVDESALAAAKGAWKNVSEVTDRLRGYWRLSQTELAEAIGLNQQKLSGRLACERHWNEEELAAVASFFRVSVGDLYGSPDDAVAVSAAAGGPVNHRGVQQTPLPMFADAAA